MMTTKGRTIIRPIMAVLLFLLFFFPGTDGFADSLALLISDADRLLLSETLSEIKLPDGHSFKVYSEKDFTSADRIVAELESADAIIVDVLVAALPDFILKHLDTSGMQVFALRTSRGNESYRAAGFTFNEELSQYYDYRISENIRNMLLMVIALLGNKGVNYNPPRILPRCGIYHPDAQEIFANFAEYRIWEQSRPGPVKSEPRIGILFYRSYISPGEVAAIDSIIRRLELAGFRVLPVFGYGKSVISDFLLTDEADEKQSTVAVVISYLFKFRGGIGGGVDDALTRLNVPVINAIRLYYKDIDEWRRDSTGLDPAAVSWNVAIPELVGLLEPTVVAGREKRLDTKTGTENAAYTAVTESQDIIIARLKKWTALQELPNREKKIAIFFYNHSQGKQHVGASYLNVFRSLEKILRRLEAEGYTVGDSANISENKIKDMILRSGRNIGSWAPGELERMLNDGELTIFPVNDYLPLFEALPETFRRKTIENWGKPEESKIMVKDNGFVIPGIRLGNILLLPEPARGWGDDPMKLYHSPEVYPHHQYIAVYQWVQKRFQADAMIHLGTHSTYEWLPGKQCGLIHSDPPEIMTGDVPNLYPYIVDDIGEGVQAKRRGRGVIVDHLTPAVKKSGLYGEYSELQGMISDLEQSRMMAAKTTDIKQRKVIAMISELGLDDDLAREQAVAASRENPDDLISAVEHYLREIMINNIPFGMHSFGSSPSGEAFDETVKNILEFNPELEPGAISKALAASGKSEMDSLIGGLSGAYIRPGQGNDPLRNPEALPTGRNFYGYDPNKIPSPAAYEFGKKAAQDIIRRALDENHQYPNKVAVILWAVETFRNEGINESTILHLLGIKPVWEKSGRVKDFEVIPRKKLARPRIDVLISPSGLYRDLFPDYLRFLDRAVQKAAAQDEIDNLIALNSRRIQQAMQSRGVPEKQAAELARIRIFSEQPGTYGTGVADLTGMSGTWQEANEIGDVFITHMSHAYGGKYWGKQSTELYREQLRDVELAIHSSSSNIYGVLDNDDFYQYLGGISRAVENVRGKAPETLVSLQRRPGEIIVESAGKSIGRESRSRYLNPKWIQAMQHEDYAGAREIAKFVDYLWGWQVTAEQCVSESQWRQVYEVYVDDKYDLEMKPFFDRANPWAYQSVTARMLEAVRKNYWQADEATIHKLAAEYAENLIEKGPACCDHTCNNPLLNEMVMNILSIPGVFPEKLAEKFKVAIEQAAGKKLSEQMRERMQLQSQLNSGFADRQNPDADSSHKQFDTDKADSANNESDLENVKGYKFEELDYKTEDDAAMSSSGIQWFVSISVLLIIIIFGWQLSRKTE